MLIREIEVAIVYVYITLTTSITFLSKLKFMHNPTLHSVTTPTNGGKKVRILSQLRELGLPVGDANRTLFLKQWPT
jgi:hypothetical protein